MSSMIDRADPAHGEFTSRVIAVVREAMLDDPGDIGPQSSFIGDLDIDSLTMVRIDMLIQAKLGLALAADDLANIETVEDLVKALLTRGQRVESE
jgi:acyl carrier protein